jgi:hypothetical protein
MPEQPKKIKIVVKPTAGAVIKKVNIKEEPITNQPTKRKKGLIPKILDIVSNDIHNLPNRIWGEKQKVKKVNMPDSKESWKDWEGEI